ncbi:MAG: oxidoreductase [Planctomycetes bacterium]|nr:oxidoreductase [Planctomycetota bacterium]
MLDKRTYLVRERIGLAKLHEAFDIFDATDGTFLASAVENASAMRKALKLLVHKNLLPFEIDLKDANQNTVLVIERGITFLRSRIRVLDPQGSLIGTFKQRLLSVGGRFELFDADDRKVADLKGNFIGWNFTFVDESGANLGTVTKKWAGVGKELFTSADNYIVALADSVDPVGTGPLLLAAALCIDMVLKER